MGFIGGTYCECAQRERMRDWLVMSGHGTLTHNYALAMICRHSHTNGWPSEEGALTEWGAMEGERGQGCGGIVLGEVWEEGWAKQDSLCALKMAK